MSDDELLKLPPVPAGVNQQKMSEKVRALRRDMESAIEECLSKYVPESCYREAKKALEGATDAFDGMEDLVNDAGEAATTMEDHALTATGIISEALNRFAPNWRDEVKIEHVGALA